MDSLLPNNATPTERSLDIASARVEAVSAPVHQLVQAATCPESLLPYLAWAVSVDEWDPAWPIERKRASIAASIEIHRRKGTAAAVQDAVATIGWETAVVEWFQEAPLATPYTFAVEAFLVDQGVTPELYDDIRRLALSAKNARSHLTRISIVARGSGGIYIGGPSQTADTITLLPAAIP